MSNNLQANSYPRQNPNLQITVLGKGKLSGNKNEGNAPHLESSNRLGNSKSQKVIENSKSVQSVETKAATRRDQWQNTMNNFYSYGEPDGTMLEPLYKFQVQNVKNAYYADESVGLNQSSLILKQLNRNFFEQFKNRRNQRNQQLKQIKS